MLFLSIVTLFVGVMDTWMGASICFFGKVGLVYNFYADEKAGKFDRVYARRVGVILLLSGIACLIAGALSLWLQPAWLAAVVALGTILCTLVAYHIHYVRSVAPYNAAQAEQHANTAG